MPDIHVLFLKSKLSYSDELHDLVERGVLRASLSAVGGAIPGLAIGTHSLVSPPPDAVEGATGDTVSDAYRLVCPSDQEPPCDLIYLQPGPGVPSSLEPADFVAFVLLTLRRGAVRQWRERVLELTPVEGVQEAVALTFGRKDLDAVVELVSDDFTLLNERLLEYTDRDDVVAHEIVYSGASRTRGFGSRRVTTS